MAPALTEGRRIAHFLVDALRYERAAEFRQRLPGTLKATLESALTQIPTITPVGMAALLPDAHGKLRLQAEGDSLTPYIGDTRVASAERRIQQRLAGKHIGIRYNDTGHSYDGGLRPRGALPTLRQSDHSPESAWEIARHPPNSPSVHHLSQTVPCSRSTRGVQFRALLT